MNSALQQVLSWKSLAQKYQQLHPILEVEEILAIVYTESSGNSNAENPSDPSWGLMQVTLPIAKYYSQGQVTTSELLLNPDLNMQCGSAFLADLKTKYGATHPLYIGATKTVSSTGWVVAYNEGEGNLLRGRSDLPYAVAFNRNLNEIKAALNEQ